MKKGKVYFAHSKKKYNTSEEAEELAFIKKHFDGKVICPYNDLGELGDIERYLEVIKSVDCVYVTENIEDTLVVVFLTNVLLR
jgi:hypothetical protein